MPIEIKKLDHLGLVAGITYEIGIVNKMNELIEENHTKKITAGFRLTAKIENDWSQKLSRFNGVAKINKFGSKMLSVC